MHEWKTKFWDETTDKYAVDLSEAEAALKRAYDDGFKAGIAYRAKMGESAEDEDDDGGR